MRILVIRLSSIGDIVLTTPVLKAIKEKYPQSVIDFVTLKNFKAAIEGNIYIDNLILFDKKINDGYFNIKKFAKELDKNNYDYVLDLHDKFRSKLIRSEINGEVRVYPKRKKWKSILVKMKAIKYCVDDTIVKNYFKAVRDLGIEYTKEDLSFYFSKSDEEKVSEYKNLFVMAIGASKETKKWLPENFGELARKLYEKYSIKTALIGGEEDEAVCRYINNISEDCCINLAGKLTLKESGALLSKSKILISNDSGPFHIGRGVGCKSFVIFGPTDPNMFLYDDMSTLIYAEEKCSPCSLHGDKKCPKKHFNCMKNIKVDMIFRKISDYLDENRNINNLFI